MSKGGGGGGGHQIVVVIQSSCTDASYHNNSNGIKWLMHELPLNHGDELIIVGISPLINTTRSSLPSPTKLLGCKGSEGSNGKVLVDELTKKKKEFAKNIGLSEFQKFYQAEKRVKLTVDVEASSSRKVATVKAAKRWCATFLVLDREMKKEKQYFMDRLSCGISAMKSNNTLVKIRGPIFEHVSYDEMIPSYSLEDLSPTRSPGTARTTSRNEATNHSQGNSSVSSFTQTSNNTESTESLEGEDTTTYEESSKELSNTGDIHSIDEIQFEKEFDNSVCSVCNNRRPKIALQKDFTYAELHEATDGFSKDNFLSEGGFGFVFKGKVRGGLKIAVKQHKPASLQGEKEFKSEVKVLSQARHQNLVMLLGSCTEGKHRLLVYEYVCNGSLQEHLSAESEQPLNWEQRIKIALGAAKGLEYLHAQNIVHRDMRPENILITHDHESLLGDFGLAKAHQDDNGREDSQVVGTLGYVAPEYAEIGLMSTKTDVYSFGVVLLQLITGLKTTDDIPEGRSLVGWARPLLESKNYPDLVDGRILDSHDVHQLFWMVLVAEKCLKKNPNSRWTMAQVVYTLNCVKEGNTSFNVDFSSLESGSDNG